MFRRFCKIFAIPPYRLLMWTRIINKKELKQHRGKGVIFCCNHRSNGDPPLLFACFPRFRLFFWAKESLFKKRILRPALKSIGAIPVKKGSDMAVIRRSLDCLKKNHALVVFPEGIRAFSPEDALALKNGASMVAIKSGVPIVPMVIKRKPRMFVPNAIKVGTTISTEQYQNKKLEKSDIAELSEKLSNTMKGMLEGFEKTTKQKKWQKIPDIIARGIVIVDGDKLLVVKRKRADKEYYVFPGGHIDEGETSRKAAVREIMEETNLKTEVVRGLYKYDYKGENYGNGMQTFFLMNYKSGSVAKTDAEEYSQCSAETIYPDGQKRGTYEPMLVPLKDLKSLDLRPACLKKQLIKDLKKCGTKLGRPLILLKEKN